jgi:hypothetical protein
LAHPERAAGDCVERCAVGRSDVRHHALDRSMPWRELKLTARRKNRAAVVARSSPTGPDERRG